MACHAGASIIRYSLDPPSIWGFPISSQHNGDHFDHEDGSNGRASITNSASMEACMEKHDLGFVDTPQKINMEPENIPLEEENHLLNHHFQVLC